MPMLRKNTAITPMTATATVASCRVEVGGQHDGKGRSRASTNLLSVGVALAGPSPLRRAKPESRAPFGLCVVLRRRHRRTVDGDDARRSHWEGTGLLIPPRLTHQL